MIRKRCALLLLVVLAGCEDMGSLVQNPECTLSVTLLDFGEAEVDEGVARLLQLRNDGNATLFGSVDDGCEHFDVIDGKGSYELDPGESMQVEVEFRADVEGSFLCDLGLGTECETVLAIGTAVIPPPNVDCDVEPASLDFGNVAVGSSADLELMLINAGNVDLDGTLTPLCADYSIVDSPDYFIAPGDTATFVVRFEPATTGLSECDLSTGVSCDDVPLSGTGDPPPTTVSFSGDVQPIFSRSCATTGCHNSTSRGGLRLGLGHSYGNLVGVTSQGYAPAKRVVPRNTNASVLYDKITNGGRFGGAMPPTRLISPADRELIRVWIVEGALEN